MPKPGAQFERDVFDWIRGTLDEGTLGAYASQASVFLHHRLYSRDRNSDIEFDVVIQLFRQGATDPFLNWIWECKDYTHRVPVDDIEEFHAKVEQVGRNNTKATMISTAGFQHGVLEFAKSNGIGLLRVAPRAPTQSRNPPGTVQFSRNRDVEFVHEWMTLAPRSGNSTPTPSKDPGKLLVGAPSQDSCFVYADESGNHSKFGILREVFNAITPAPPDV